MAFTVNIGFPEPRMYSTDHSDTAAKTSVTFKRVLQVVVKHHGNWVWSSIAVADSDNELRKFLSVWLSAEHNKHIFSGQSRIELVPDISS